MANRIFLLLVVVIVSSGYSTTANAAINANNLLDNVLNSYVAVANGWAATIQARATYLFWILATISMVWTFGMLHLRRADIGEFYGEFIRFAVFTGFFNWLLINGPQYATDIINSMKTIGANASGNATALTPSAIADIGFNIFFRVLDQSTIWQPVDSAAGIIISLIILICMALIGVNMLILLISGWILAYAGVFFLGFGGSRWTSDMAIGYFKTVLNIGVQLLTMILLVGIGKDIVSNYYNNMDANMNLREMGVMLIAAIVLLVLTNKVPSLVGQLAMGGGSHALGQGYGAGTAMAAAGAASAVAAIGGAMMASAASNIAGGAQAIQAAYQKANEYSPNVGGMALAGQADYKASGGSSDKGSSQSSFAQAMGFNKNASSSASTSKQDGAWSAGGLLARGVNSVIGEKMQERIDQSFMGQVATAIKNDTPEINEPPVFDGNSLSDASTPEQEIEAFVKRTA